MERERVKALIELSDDVSEADEIISKEIKTTNEKIAFLRGMFDFSIIGRCRDNLLDSEDKAQMDYYSILSAIINAKWEA